MSDVGKTCEGCRHVADFKCTARPPTVHLIGSGGSVTMYPEVASVPSGPGPHEYIRWHQRCAEYDAGTSDEPFFEFQSMHRDHDSKNRVAAVVRLSEVVAWSVRDGHGAVRIVLRCGHLDVEDVLYSDVVRFEAAWAGFTRQVSNAEDGDGVAAEVPLCAARYYGNVYEGVRCFGSDLERIAYRAGFAKMVNPGCKVYSVVFLPEEINSIRRIDRQRVDEDWAAAVDDWRKRDARNR